MGRAQPCQGWGRGFESLRPLQFSVTALQALGSHDAGRAMTGFPRIRDFREGARQRLPRMLFDYLDGGSFDEITLERNRRDLDRLALEQRVLRDMGGLSTATSLL